MTHARSLGRVLSVTACGLALPLLAAAANPPDLVGLLAQYERGEFAAVERAMADIPLPPRRPAMLGMGDPNDPVFIELQKVAPRWIAGGDSPGTPRRRLIAAAFALELANTRRLVPWTARYPLVVWACELLRREPTHLAAERWWYLASLALLEDADDWTHVLGEDRAKSAVMLNRTQARFYSRADQQEFSAGHLSHAEAAFSDEPRLHLAQVLFDERQTMLPNAPFGINSQQTSPDLLESLDRMIIQRIDVPTAQRLDPKSVKSLLEKVARIPDLEDRYIELGRHEALRADASLHLGFLRIRLESWEEALGYLDQVPLSTSEPMLIGASHHFRGWVYEQTGRHDEAIAAYRAALALAPLARSTSILLAAQLTETGEQKDAYAVLDSALRASPAADRPAPNVPASTVPDLWPLYTRGDALMLRSFLLRLREALR